MLTFEISFDGLENIIALSREYPRVAQRSLNRVAQSTKTEASRQIRDTYNVRKQTVDASFTVRLAHIDDLKATIRSSGRRLPIMEFAARQVARGVSFAIKKGERKILTHAFLATMPGGHVGVFMRRGKDRLPIDEKFTISVAEMFGARAIFNELQAFAVERLGIEFPRQLDYYLSQQ
jgi:hypothetical protein